VQISELRQDLGGAWQFKGLAPSRAGSAFLPATVPGNVHTDLMAAGKLKDPFIGDHEADVAWVEQTPWEYRRRFSLEPAMQAAGRVRLVAEGLDTWCTLWLNGKKLGRTENSFVEHVFDVTRLLKAGANELVLRFEPPTAVLMELQAKQGFSPGVGEELRSQGRKAQYSFGWDWGPRLATSGVFRPISLQGDRGLRIEDLHCRTLKADAASANGYLEASVHAERAMSLPLRASLGGWSLQKQLKLKKGVNKLRLPWKLAKPQLWWPRGHGAPFLYQAELSLGGLSRASVSAGIRTVELHQAKDLAGRGFELRVNGVPVFCKGANWIPADNFLGRVTDERIEALVQRAVEANFTMLRIWGGGLYEDERFYNACDRAGLLVWQDFLFACNEVPEHPAFVSLVKEEARKAVTRLRRHPSLALWCGNNENHQARYDHWFRGRESQRWGALFYEKVLKQICAELDPSRPYWPGSPYGGANPNSEQQGDRHNWQVWANFADYEDYRLDRGRFVSEFGFAALPNRALLKQAIPAGERWLQSRTMQIHDKVERGGALARIAYFIMAHLPYASGLDAFRYLSQVNQRRALTTAIEHWRRHKPHTQGALFWQLNDCWPVTSWAVLDGHDTPKLAWYGVRESCDDVLLSSVEAAAVRMTEKVGTLPIRAAEEDGRCEAWLTLDGPQAFRGKLRVERWGAKGREAVLGNAAVNVPANASRRIWERRRQACGIHDPAAQYLVFTLTGAAGASRRSVLYFERPKRMELKPAGLVVGAKEDGDGFQVAVRSQHLALAVELHAPVAGEFSDNGFDLLPGETKILRFTPAKDGAVKGAWQALCLNQFQAEARRS
jgi:beta-mannosidase